jgi:hypothetical protein
VSFREGLDEPSPLARGLDLRREVAPRDDDVSTVDEGRREVKTRAISLYVADAFRETDRAWGFTLPDSGGRRVDVYVPKSQAIVLPSGRLRVAPWLIRATAEKQGVSL